MAMDRTRIIELIELMQKKTIANGCTPGEAAKFAAKVAEWIEKYAIQAAELRAAGGSPAASDEMEVCENRFRTGKKAFNPGMTAIFNGLARGMCCRLILIHDLDAVYGVIGDELDANYVCQIAATIIPALQLMAKLDGAEHGREKAGLVRWQNQYLIGAGDEIYARLTRERAERTAVKEAERRVTGSTCTALAIVTGETIAVAKREAADEALKRLYPKTRQTRSRMEFDGAAYHQGKEAGKRVGLNLTIE